MAKDDETPDDEDEGGGKKKRVIMVVGAILAVGAVYQFVLAPAPAPEDEEALAEGVERTIEEGEVVAVPELVLNLADQDELRYLRVGAAVILEEGYAADAFESDLPIVSDIMVEVLSSKTLAELREPGAKEAAKEELSERAREAFDDSTIARVIFTSFVMQ